MASLAARPGWGCSSRPSSRREVPRIWGSSRAAARWRRSAAVGERRWEESGGKTTALNGPYFNGPYQWD